MDPMTMMLATTALSGGLSFMSGIGQQQSTAKQNRLQMIENARMDELNQARLAVVNQTRERLGREYLDSPAMEAQDIAAFRAAGESLGYNPVTWLNSGALSLFQRNKLDAYKMMVPDAQYGTPTTIQRVPSTLEVIGNAGNAALNTFQGMYKTQMSQDMQWNMLDRQLQAMAGLANRNGSVGGGVSGSGATSASGTSSKGSGALTGLPNWGKWEAEFPSVTNPWPSARVDPRTADAEGVEDRYGDAISWIYGGYVAANDFVKNFTGTNIPTGLSNVWSGKYWGGDTYRPGPLIINLRKQAGMQ